MTVSDPVRIVQDGTAVTNANPLPVDIMALPALPTVVTSELWRVTRVSDVALDDSDKSFVVPAATEWQILWIWVELTSTAIVGNRQLEIQIIDTGPDVVASWARAAAVQAATLTRNYLFAPAVADITDFRDTDYMTTPVPVGAFLKAGQTLRVFDNNAVDAAADDMVVHIQRAERAV